MLIIQHIGKAVQDAFVYFQPDSGANGGNRGPAACPAASVTPVTVVSLFPSFGKVADQRVLFRKLLLSAIDCRELGIVEKLLHRRLAPAGKFYKIADRIESDFIDNIVSRQFGQTAFIHIRKHSNLLSVNTKKPPFRMAVLPLTYLTFSNKLIS